jgi:hypothetical protein
LWSLCSPAPLRHASPASTSRFPSVPSRMSGPTPRSRRQAVPDQRVVSPRRRSVGHIRNDLRDAAQTWRWCAVVGTRFYLGRVSPHRTGDSAAHRSCRTPPWGKSSLVAPRCSLSPTIRRLQADGSALSGQSVKMGIADDPSPERSLETLPFLVPHHRNARTPNWGSPASKQECQSA